MAWVKEFSATSSVSATNTLIATVPAGGVSAGHFLVLGIAHRGTGVATWGVTDSRSNAWTVNLTKAVGAATGDAAVMVTCVVATTLQAGDTITMTSSTATVDRIAACFEEFDDIVTAIDTSSTNDNAGASSASPTSLSFTTTQNDELLIGVLNMVSIGRVYTPDAPWTAGTKIATSSGTGDRAVVVQWRTVATTGSYAASGTFNSSALYAFVGAGFKTSAVAPRTGKAKVWNGSAWVAHPAKVWNGSSWVAHPMKGWDGSSWTTGK
jgi:hypothetical protein